MAYRTPIMVGPETLQFTVSEDADAQRVANWRARGLAPLPLTSGEVEDITYLRQCNMEFALLSDNLYMPPGLRVNDLMRLFVARNGWMSSNNPMQRTVTAEVLQLKKGLRAAAAEIVRLKSVNEDAHENRLHEVEVELRAVIARLAAYGAEYADAQDADAEQGEPDEVVPMAEAGGAAAATSPAHRSPEVSKLTYMSRMEKFAGQSATPFRSWQE